MTGPPLTAPLFLTLALLSGPSLAADPAAASPGQTVTVASGPQDWQARRSEFARIVNQLGSSDTKDYATLHAVLDEFEQKPFTRTPMENMEILGVYYVPAEGIEKTLPFIAANAALGWYDALRYGSESGRAEILHNEGFFKIPLVLVGQEYAEAAVRFFTEQPAKAAELVQRGLAMAEPLKDDPRYDHRWPSAYGLEQVMCALGAECAPPSAVPREQWGEAWAETKARVARYYRINAPEPEAPAKAAPSKKKR